MGILKGIENYKMLWDVVVQDTHVLARMFAAVMDGLMNV
jgi:hypothetical protein